MILIHNGHAILPGKDGHFNVKENAALLIKDGMIDSIIDEKDVSEKDVDRVFDSGGRYISPGFINIHIHGCFGYDTMDGTPAAIAGMARTLPKTGVTSFVPTTMTCPLPKIHRALAAVRAAMEESPTGARIIGCNLEGPFISSAQKGSQEERDILPPDFSLIEADADIIRYITIAPERLNGRWSFIDECRRHGIIVSIGHTDASYDAAMDAIRHGASHFTHMFNAMTGFHHRSPGTLGAALDSDVICELITDNVHSHPAAQRLAWNAKKGHGIVLVTDSLRACGLGDGESELGGHKVFVKGPVARLSDGTIAASVAPMDHVLRCFAANTGIGIARTTELVSKVPASELGLTKLGVLRTGTFADITVFDKDFHIYASFVEGKSLYGPSPQPLNH